ncbi:MAG: hypothetical protein KDA71_05190, partial [Planctomycetales bacterium]|nr:hypothetical protein [Planctomycetales bacterium]
MRRRWRDRRKPLPELAKNAKRPTADLSTPGVNWSVVSFRRKETSSPKGTLFETILAALHLLLCLKTMTPK